MTVEQPFCILQARMMPVFFRKDDAFRRKPPVNAQIRVVPGQGTFMLRGIKVVAFILEYHFRSEHAETVGESSWNEELPVVVFGKFHSHVLAERGGTLPDVYRHVENGSFDNPHQFALGERRFLEMQSAKYAIAALAFVVLYKVHGTHLLFEVTLREGFKKISPFIVEQARLDDDHAVDSCFYYFHIEYTIMICSANLDIKSDLYDSVIRKYHVFFTIFVVCAGFYALIKAFICPFINSPYGFCIPLNCLIFVPEKQKGVL